MTGLDDRLSGGVPLTREMFAAAAKAIYDQPYRPDPCKLGRHIVSPRALYRPGWYRCVSCGGPVEVTYPLSER